MPLLRADARPPEIPGIQSVSLRPWKARFEMRTEALAEVMEKLLHLKSLGDA
jgi:hypothetical protein